MDYESELKLELQADLTRYASTNDWPHFLARMSTLDPEFDALWIEAIAGWAYQHQDNDEVMGWFGFWCVRHPRGWGMYTRAIALLQQEIARLRRLAA